MQVEEGVAVRVFYLGRSEEVRDELARATGTAPKAVLPEELVAGDVVFFDIDAHDGVPHGNALSACRSLKAEGPAKVFVLIEQGDLFSAEIARFCLADGCHEVVPGEGFCDPDAVVRRLQPHAPKIQVSPLLAELERKLRSDEGRSASVIQKMLAEDRQAWILEHLTDPETGLFAGPFASFKLDEEFKRAYRFHQPMSVMLLDIGPGEAVLPPSDDLRRACLAEVAAVLLNECRDIDVLARFTETTFLLLLPGTGLDGARLLGRRILADLESRPIHSRGPLVPRAGVVTVPAAGIDDRRTLLTRAEACLRLAQDGGGRDGLCAAGA